MCVEKIGSFLPPALANAAWAFAKLGVHHHALFTSIAFASVKQIAEFKSDTLSMLAWAFATLHESPTVYGSMFLSVAHHACIHIRTFNPDDLAKLLWSFARQGTRQQNTAVHSTLCFF